MGNLKFRAWDKRYNKMVDVKSIEFEGEVCPIFGMQRVPTINRGINIADVELMQYIGLKDKYNKDIYEEDIVRVPANYSGDHYYRECIAIVRYEENEFTLYNPLDKDGIVWQDFAWNSLEIIGNTYENPELLGENNGRAT